MKVRLNLLYCHIYLGHSPRIINSTEYISYCICFHYILYTVKSISLYMLNIISLHHGHTTVTNHKVLHTIQPCSFAMWQQSHNIEICRMFKIHSQLQPWKVFCFGVTSINHFFALYFPNCQNSSFSQVHLHLEFI